ncbi:hypothetical protein [Sorangium sp. So ce1153]|uniref:monooxygenase n=1 Tax=Sorangium sp. So ce1153 TaxID=3133333 RepID=UPI003F61267F
MASSRCERGRYAVGFAAVALLALAVAGCGTGSEPEPEPEPEPEAQVTWHGDIEPLVQRACASCHDSGGVGGVTLTDAATARALSGRMAARVASGEMPPPALDPSCRPYTGADRMNLDAAERERFAAWASAGAPLGDPSEAPPPGPPAPHLGDPDVVLEMPEAHEVAPDADGNEYYCMILDNPLDAPAWITSLEALPGDPEVVHHMGLYRDQGHDAGAGYGAPPGAKGFACREPVLELDWQLLHAWAPGGGRTEFPAGTGLRIAPDDQLVLQIHYYSPRKLGAVDRSSYHLRTAPGELDTEVTMDVFGPVPFTIPAGAAAHTERSSFESVGAPTKIYGLLPHMHLLGRSYNAWIEDEAGAPSCLARGAFEFHHQALYMFDEPVTLLPGQRLVTECTWDNSAASPDQYNDPPRDVAWGEGTTQEMCFLVAYISQE